MENVLQGSNGARQVFILCVVVRGIGPVALAVSMLCACSDPNAGTLPSTSPSPSFSVSATPTATASVDLRAQLRTALDAYFDALYAAGLDPANKTDALAALIAPSCSCYRVVHVLREQAKRRRYVDYRYTLSDVTVVDVTQDTGVVNYTVAQSAGALRDASGEAVEIYEPSRTRYSARLSNSEQGWLLDRVEQLA